MNVDLRALGSIRRSVPQRGGRKIPSVSRRTNMDGGTGISGAAVGVLVDVGCATAISGFTVGSNRTVSALMSTVADDASVIPSKPSDATQKPGEIRPRSRRHQASTPRISAAPDAWSTADHGALGGRKGCADRIAQVPACQGIEAHGEGDRDDREADR